MVQCESWKKAKIGTQKHAKINLHVRQAYIFSASQILREITTLSVCGWLEVAVSSIMAFNLLMLIFAYNDDEQQFICCWPLAIDSHTDHSELIDFEKNIIWTSQKKMDLIFNQ